MNSTVPNPTVSRLATSLALALVLVACDATTIVPGQADAVVADVAMPPEDTARADDTGGSADTLRGADAEADADDADADAAELDANAVEDTHGVADVAEILEAEDAVADADGEPVDSAESADTASTAADTTGAETTAAEVPVLHLPIIVPAGFYPTDEGRGFTIYRKDYAGGQPDWMAVIDLRVARLRSVLGEITNEELGEIQRRAVIEHWDDAVAQATSSQTRARLLISGAHFLSTADQTPVAHGLKVNGKRLGDGYALAEFPGSNMTLAWHATGASAAIAPWEGTTFEAYSDVVGGLAHNTPAQFATNYKQRAFAGVRDFDGDGEAEALFLYASRLAKQAEAKDVLTAFGATSWIMFTGRDSAAFVVDGVERVSPEVTLPHMIAVYEGPPGTGCGPGCSAHGTCDATTHQCVCDPGFSGAACGTCTACAAAAVVVDDMDAGFSTFGLERYWWRVADRPGFAAHGHAGGFHYTLSDPVGTQVWTGRWQTPTPLTGTYKVEVFIAAPDDFDPWTVAGPGPDHWVACDALRYVVLHDGAPEGEEVLLDPQTAGWRTLLATASYSTRRGDIRVHDRATPQWCGVQLDAVRWTRLP